MSVESAVRATDVFHHRFHSSCDDGTTLVHFRCERENGGGEDGGRHGARGEYSDLHVVARPPAAGGRAAVARAAVAAAVWREAVAVRLVLAQFVARFRRQFVAGKSVLELGGGRRPPRPRRGARRAARRRRRRGCAARGGGGVDGVDGGGGGGRGLARAFRRTTIRQSSRCSLNLALNGLAAGGTAPPPPRPASRADDDGGGGDAARARRGPPCSAQRGCSTGRRTRQTSARYDCILAADNTYSG